MIDSEDWNRIDAGFGDRVPFLGISLGKNSIRDLEVDSWEQCTIGVAL